MSTASIFRNAHLDGSAFYWQAGLSGVLLLHGFTATTTEVRLLAGSLHENGYTVSAPLLPGHGTTPQDCNRYTWHDWYATAEQAYQQLSARCQVVIVGGESTGALLAVLLAQHHPEASAILCYAPALRLKINRVKRFLLTLCVPFITSVPKSPSRDDNLWKGYTVYPLRGAYELTLLQKTVPPILPLVHQPILIMQGRLDQAVHPQSPQLIYDRIGSSMKELHWLEHSTHCLILDKERNLAADLTLAFLRRVCI